MEGRAEAEFPIASVMSCVVSVRPSYFFKISPRFCFISRDEHFVVDYRTFQSEV